MSAASSQPHCARRYRLRGSQPHCARRYQLRRRRHSVLGGAHVGAMRARRSELSRSAFPIPSQQSSSGLRCLRSVPSLARRWHRTPSSRSCPWTATKSPMRAPRHWARAESSPSSSTAVSFSVTLRSKISASRFMPLEKGQGPNRKLGFKVKKRICSHRVQVS